MTQPVLFIAGEEDIVIGGASATMLRGMMNLATEDLRDVILLPEAGHWVQQELPKETNAAIISFLKDIE